MARPSFVPPSDPTRDHLAAAHALSPGCSTRAYVDTLALLNQLWKDHVLQVSQFAHKISPSQPSPPPPNNPSSGCWAKRSYSWKASCLTTILHLQHLQFNLQHLTILHLWKHLTAVSVFNIFMFKPKIPTIWMSTSGKVLVLGFKFLLLSLDAHATGRWEEAQLRRVEGHTPASNLKDLRSI